MNFNFGRALTPFTYSAFLHVFLILSVLYFILNEVCSSEATFRLFIMLLFIFSSKSTGTSDGGTLRLRQTPVVTPKSPKMNGEPRNAKNKVGFPLNVLYTVEFMFFYFGDEGRGISYKS